MPSSHTSFVVSLTAMVAIREGLDSILFAIAFVFSYIVIYDAMFIRTNIGYNGKVLNELIREIPGIKKENYPTLRERVGHKPMEVLVGGVMGMLLTAIFILILEAYNIGQLKTGLSGLVFFMPSLIFFPHSS